MFDTRYTLLIPTHNRPDDLGRLLRFLARQEARFRIVVLDSSRTEVQQRNAAQARNLALDLLVESFDATTPPWEKFRRGIEMVRTEYSSICADDDLVLVPALREILAFLDGCLDYSAAHGWYFNFSLGKGMDLPGVVYRGGSIDHPDPIVRLQQLFSRYEALTYAVHRTRVLKAALRRAARMRNMMLSELLGGAIAVALGKTARLPVLYYGRSLAPSQAYHGWHPVEFLIDSPAALFRDYLPYRSALIDTGLARYALAGDQARLRQLVDLIHLRYLSEYYRPAVVDHVIRSSCRGHARGDTLRDAWSLLAPKPRGFVDLLARGRLARSVRDRYLPWLRAHHLPRFVTRRGFDTLRQRAAGDAERTYRIYSAFRDAVVQLPDGRSVTDDLVRRLNAYA